MSDWINDEDWDAPPAVRTETNNKNTEYRNTSSTSSYSYDDRYRNNYNSNADEKYSDNLSRTGSGRGALINRRHEKNNNYYESTFNSNSSSLSNRKTYEMMVDSKAISSIIGKSGVTITNIKEKCNVKIQTPSKEESSNQRQVCLKISGFNQDDIDRAKTMINQIISSSSNNNSFKRNYASEENYNDHDRFSFSESKKSNGYKSELVRDSYENEKKPSTSEVKPGMIDWDMVRSLPDQDMSKFKDHPPIIKDFYYEDPDITAMSQEEVDKYRKENFNITVDLFKKQEYTLSKKNEDTRSPEEIKAYLDQTIPKPVLKIEQAFRKFPEIIEQCNLQNYTKPTPIQSQIWPILLKGIDCVGIAQTGTGKTMGFLLPALIHIDNQITPREKRPGPNVLVLSPTRELAIQIDKEVKKINYKGIQSVCVYGGGDRKEQVNVCTKGVQIVIATPGRLYDLIQAGIINVTSVTYLVIDEADRMLDLGFEPQIMKILLDIRPDRQTVMTSATWPEGVRRLATKYLNEPIQLYVGSLDLRAAKTVTQVIEMVSSEDEKRDRLMRYIEHEMDETDKLMVFVGRKATADNLSCDLILKSISCQSIHGDREQCDREEALEDFKESRTRILIATDVASRGIDVRDITCVINYDFPRNIEEYVHRVGRTGRAGRTGVSITFMAREDWKHAKELIEILKQGQQIVPDALIDMASRYEAMLKRKAESFDSGRGGSGGGGFRDRNSGFSNSGRSSGGGFGQNRQRRDNYGGFHF